MSNRLVTMERLMETLEQLGAQEELALIHADGEGLDTLQKRSAPLVASMVTLSREGPVPPAIDARVQAYIAARHLRLERLRLHLEVMHAEFNSLEQARARLRSMRPASAPTGETFAQVA